MLFNWIRRNAVWISLGFCGLLLLSTLGLDKLSVTPNNRVFYGPSNPYFQEFLEFESNYTPNNNIMFVISGPTTVSNKRYAYAIRWLTDSAWNIHNTIRVDSLSTYPIAKGSDESITVKTILELVCPTNNECIDANRSELDRPQILNRLISPDHMSTGVVATVALEVGVLGAVEQITADTEKIASEFRRLFPKFELVVTGGVPMMQAFATYSEADLSVLLPIALISIFILLVVFFGGFIPAFLLVTMALVAVTCTLGFAAWTDHTLNSATSIVPLVVFTLVITSSMHILIHFLRLTTDSPGYADYAARAALEGNLTPMLVSAATTAIGLLSLSFLDSPPLRELGYLSAIGVLFGTSLSLLVLPIALSKLSSKYSSRAVNLIQKSLNTYARRLESGKSYAGISFVLMSLSIFGLWQIEIDDNFVEYFSTDTEFRQSTDRATALLAGPNHIEVLLENPEADGIFDPNYINHLSDLSGFLRSESIVSNVSSFSDILLDLSSAFGRSLNEGVSAEELAQWYLVYELSLRRGQSNTDFVRADQNQSRISVLLSESTSVDIQALESKIYDWHKQRKSPFQIRVTGENIPVAHLSGLNIKSMVAGIFLSIFATACLVGYLVKKFRLGLVTLAATILPIMFGFGFWGLFNESIGLASTAIIALTIGIVVDDAIHMVYRFLDARSRLESDPLEAAAFSLHRVGTAITTTSIVMVGGLFALLFSNFELNSSFGACTCLIIALALLFDLLVLPQLLVWADKKQYLIPE